MTPSPDTERITRLLGAMRAGDTGAFRDLYALVYAHLHRLAHQRRRQWDGNDTINTTALVHEVYLKLVKQEDAEYDDASHFFGVASRAMRHVLIDYARQRRAARRGGAQVHVPLDESIMGSAGQIPLERLDDLISLDRALERLEAISERNCRIFECRFFGGMTVEETARAQSVGTATVKRGWAMAQLWLYRALHEETGPA